MIDGSGGLTIGEGCDISAGAQIYSHSTTKRVVSGRVIPVERAATTIGNRVHVGAGAVVLMGCTIGDDVIIGAGCVVREHSVIPTGSIVVGVPGRILERSVADLLSDEVSE